MTTLQSSSYFYDMIVPRQPHCTGRGCYCFYNKSPLDIEDDISVISSVTDYEDYDDDYVPPLPSFDNQEEDGSLEDLPPIVFSVISPFLEPDDDDDYVPPNKHLYFDEHGNEITETEYMANEVAENEDLSSTEYDPDDDWAFKVNKITFRHPRVLLAYFRFVELQHEVTDEDEHVRVPLIHPDIAAKMLSHSSFTDRPPEFEADIAELEGFIRSYTKKE